MEGEDVFSLLNIREVNKPTYGNNGVFLRKNAPLKGINKSQFHLRRDVLSEFSIYT